MDNPNGHMEQIANLLETRKQYRKYIEFLPTPDFIQEIITLTNKGQIKLALNKIKYLESILAILQGDIDSETKEWLVGIIFMLNKAVNAEA